MARPKKQDIEAVDRLLNKFDLKKYQCCRDYSLSDWFYQLVARQDLFNRGPLARAPLHASPTKTAKLLLEDPLGYGKNRSYGQRIRDGIFDQPVRSTTIAEVWQQRSNVERMMPELAEELDYFFRLPSTEHRAGHYYPQKADESFEQSMLRYEAPDEKAFYEDVADVRVNLSATDAEILKGFKEWLRSARKWRDEIGVSSPRKKTFSEIDCLEWANKRLLPYIDLQIIADCYQLDVRQVTCGEALFKDFSFEAQDRAKAMKSKVAAIRRDAEQLMKTETLRALIISSQEVV
tara:strand:- start:149 stop:1021 length:873 start_codon:yes stop_codon:yes gene_type:complete